MRGRKRTSEGEREREKEGGKGAAKGQRKWMQPRWNDEKKMKVGELKEGGRQGRMATLLLGLFRAEGFQLRFGLIDHRLAAAAVRAPAAAVGAAACTT